MPNQPKLPKPEASYISEDDVWVIIDSLQVEAAQLRKRQDEIDFLRTLMMNFKDGSIASIKLAGESHA